MKRARIFNVLIQARTITIQSWRLSFPNASSSWHRKSALSTLLLLWHKLCSLNSLRVQTDNNEPTSAQQDDVEYIQGLCVHHPHVTWHGNNGQNKQTLYILTCCHPATSQLKTDLSANWPHKIDNRKYTQVPGKSQIIFFPLKWMGIPWILSGPPPKSSTL